jgi:hypothetical protein
MRPNLIIVPVGDGSLHAEWCTPSPRSYDVWVVYYGDDDQIARRYRETCDRYFVGKGQKFRILLDLVVNLKEAILRYEHVWFPDDDLRFHNGPVDADRMFALARELRADCWQPAIANALVYDGPLVGTYCSPNWESCLLVKDAAYHQVTSVEMMMFGFSRDALARCFFPACFLLRNSRTGWGVEQVVTILMHAWKGAGGRFLVLDAIPVIHTKPLGSNPEHNKRGHEDMQMLEFIIRGIPRQTLRVQPA